jgi:AraC-like DNA-binding protein
VSIDPLLVNLVEGFTEALGAVARRQRTGALAAPLSRWGGHDVIDFVTRLRRATSDEFMGLAGSPCALGCTDLVIDISCRCETLREALSLGIRLFAVGAAAVEVALIENGREAALEFSAGPDAEGPDPSLVDWLMIVWHKRAQWLIGSEIPLDRTEFAHPLDTHYSSYAQMFGGDCAFNAQTSRFAFARSFLDRRIVRTPADGEHMKGWMPGYFGNPVGLAKTWKQQIKSVLRVQISRGETPSSVADLAREFGVSGQTLRRRLRAEGASYRSIKAQVRREFAIDVLADRGSTLADASIAAGFAEPNALTRALKAANGMNCRELRDEARRWRGGQP